MPEIAFDQELAEMAPYMEALAKATVWLRAVVDGHVAYFRPDRGWMEFLVSWRAR